MSGDMGLMIGTAATAMVGLMGIVWLIYLPMKNAGIVDIAWAFGLAMIACIYAMLGEGASVRRLVMAAMVSFWGLRLAYHLWVRVVGHPEDGRYAELRAEWAGSNIHLRFLGFFQLQAVLNIFLSVPFLVAALNPSPELSMLELAGAVIWLCGLVGESVADNQLRKFKSNLANAGKTCRAGLWNYSRHPNYFFEWLVWVGYFVFGLSSPFGMAGILSPLLMLYFLFKVTGIPATEAQALRTRGDDYRDYQKTTSPFIPWFKSA